MVVAGQMLAGRYQARAKMGTGGFADIFLGVDLVTGQEVAIKATNQKQGPGLGLKWESQVLDKINGEFAPKLVHYSEGEIGMEGFPYIVMELLRGEDLSEIRHRQSSSRLPIAICVHLALEMVKLLERLHGLGIIHRDIKPNNFMRRRKDDKKLCLIDFGIAKRIIDESGKIRPERSSADFRGTTMYASVQAHHHKDLSKRDDLFSVFYVFIDLLLGQTPWAEAAKAKDKEAVLAAKEKYMKRPDKLVKEDAVLSARPDSEKLINLIARINKFLNQLTYEDTPNYDKLKKLFREIGELAAAEGEGKFEWEPIKTYTGGLGRARQDEEQYDADTRQHFCNEQVTALDFNRLTEADHALMWTRVVRRVISTDADKLLDKRQLLDRMMDIAERHQQFFLVDDLEEVQFNHVQLEGVYRLERALGKGPKRKRAVAGFPSMTGPRGSNGGDEADAETSESRAGAATPADLGSVGGHTPGTG